MRSVLFTDLTQIILESCGNKTTTAIDSYIRLILPEDISEHLRDFLIGKENFPFVASHELMCIMFMYGKRTRIDEKVKTEAIDLARQTVDRIHLRVEGYKRNPITKMNTEYIRSGYIERELQIRTEENRVVSNDRIVNDPIILCSCFEQHVSYYNQTFFFQIYGPLRENELLKNLGYLAGTMIMLGYNRKNEESLPFQHAMIPFYVWMSDHQIDKK